MNNKKIDHFLIDIQESLEPLEEPIDNDINFKLDITQGFSEAVIDSTGKKARVTVIREGTSHNRFHYGLKALEDIAEHLNTTAKKVYLNHRDKGSKAYRKVEDWCANVDSAEVVEENGIKQVKADITLLKGRDSEWLIDRMRDYPQEFGPSISGRAKMSVGVKDGKKVNIVEAVPVLASFDIVAEPSAGGKIDVVQESIEWRDNEVETNEALQTYMERIKIREKEQKVRDEYYNFNYAFSDMISDMVLGKGLYEELSIADRKKDIPKAFADGAKTVGGLTFMEPQKKEKVVSVSDKVEVVKENEKIEESKSLEEDEMTKQELMEKYPEIYEAIENGAVEAFKVSTKTDGLATKVSDLTEALAGKDTEVEDLTKKIDDLELEKVTLTESVNGFKAVEITATKADIVSGVIKESKLTDTMVTDHFVEKMNKMELVEGKEDEFKAAVLLDCEDRFTAISENTADPKKVVTNNGTPQKKADTKEVSESKRDLDGFCDLLTK